MCANHAKVAHSTFDRWLKRGELLSDYLHNGGNFNAAESYSWAKTAVVWLRDLERELSISNGALTKEHKACLKLWDEFCEATDACVIECLNTIDKAKNIDPIWAEKTLRKFFPDDYEEKPEAEAEHEVFQRSPTRLTADMIAGSFSNLHLDILDHAHTEYVLTGGRGSTKSSFISLELISLLENNPTWHALVLRQVGNTLRDSVYSQISWAIHQIGHGDRFKFTLSPLEITYLPTGQKIYFRGADDPNKIKSIKPEFGAIGILWFEELDQYDGANAIRKIEQSAIRGTDSAYIFKSFNPPPTANNWANKYVQIPKAKQLLHFSNYLDVPKKWLGQVFYDEAEHLKLVNPRAYEHEYMGIANATGGQVFENVIAREITDAEIAQFDRVEHGLDFGYYPDPAHYARVHYDAARLTLYVYGEVRRYKTRNEELFKALTAYGYNPADMLICDNAEPKSVEDFISYGANARRAEKGADSVTYSIKWLQSLAAIVIDPKRAPETLTEFLDYEYERTKDGEVISAFPDKNNHAIDAVRYATNLIWRKRGQ